jgi:predicted nuclease of predicted toxin-antitoxin system
LQTPTNGSSSPGTATSASHLLNATPARFLVVSTGNITNRELLSLFDEHLDAVVAAFEGARLVQLSADDLSVLDDT